MSNKELVEKIRALNYYPKIFTVQLKRHYPNLYKELYARTEFLDSKASGFERLYCLAENISERQVCPVCKKNFLKFNYAANSYRLACSSHCLNKLDSHKQHVTAALNKCRDQIVQKFKATCKQRYGGNAPACSNIVKEKMARTKIARYGNSKYNNRKKYIRTCLDKYGVKNVFNINYIRKNTIKSIQKSSYCNNVSNASFDTIPLFSFDNYCNRTSNTDQLRFKLQP